METEDFEVETFQVEFDISIYPLSVQEQIVVMAQRIEMRERRYDGEVIVNLERTDGKYVDF